jgi:hypothetical protein
VTVAALDRLAHAAGWQLQVVPIQRGSAAQAADACALIEACGLTSRQEVVDVFDRFYPQNPIKPTVERWLDANFA